MRPENLSAVGADPPRTQISLIIFDPVEPTGQAPVTNRHLSMPHQVFLIGANLMLESFDPLNGGASQRCRSLIGGARLPFRGKFRLWRVMATGGLCGLLLQSRGVLGQTRGSFPHAWETTRAHIFHSGSQIIEPSAYLFIYYHKYITSRIILLGKIGAGLVSAIQVPVHTRQSGSD